MSGAGSPFVGQLSPDGRWRWDGSAWTAVPVPAISALPSWLNLRLRTQATWAAVASALIVGVLTDQALRVGVFGLAASLAVVAGCVFLISAGRLNRAEQRVLVALGAVFAGWMTVRASPWLLWPDLLASLLLAGFAASTSAKGSIADLGTAEVSARAIHALAHVSAGAAYIARPLAASRSRFRSLGPVARGLIIALPICALLSALLASADPVFASFLSFNVDVGQLLADISFVAIGLLAMAGVLRLAAAEPLGRIEGPAWRLGATEALVVLALLDAVFTAFAIAQVLAITGAANETLKSAGVTYSEYARSGFFQLLWVGGITLVVLILVSRISRFSRTEHRLAFLVLSETAIALTLLIVVVAFQRLSLYENAYGFTMLRLYSHIFAVWMGAVFVLLGADLLGAWPRRRWFVGATMITSLIVLLALNFVNPESLVVTLNLNHAQSAHDIDTSYLTQLSSDATPALANSDKLRSVACRGPRAYAPPIGAFNWSDAQAAAARHARCEPAGA